MCDVWWAQKLWHHFRQLLDYIMTAKFWWILCASLSKWYLSTCAYALKMFQHFTEQMGVINCWCYRCWCRKTFKMWKFFGNSSVSGWNCTLLSTIRTYGHGPYILSSSLWFRSFYCFTFEILFNRSILERAGPFQLFSNARWHSSGQLVDSDDNSGDGGGGTLAAASAATASVKCAMWVFM